MTVNKITLQFGIIGMVFSYLLCVFDQSGIRGSMLSETLPLFFANIVAYTLFLRLRTTYVITDPVQSWNEDRTHRDETS